MWIYVVLILLIVLTTGKISKVHYRWAASMLTKFEVMYTKLTTELKEHHLQILNTVKSNDKDRLAEGTVRLLEIGTGPGANFQYFPKNFKVIATDPNPFFKDAFENHMKKYPDIEVERMIIAKADDLSEVENNSVDVVLSTLVLCSVDDLSVTMKEVMRVLTPGGKFVFWEHCGDAPGGWRRTFQNISDATYWPYLLEGCHLSRDIPKAVNMAGFSNVEMEKFYCPTNGSVEMYLIQSHVKGVATK